MTDDQLGKYLYEYTARGWPHKLGWENLPKFSQSMWIERAKKKVKEQQDGGGQ